jgi:hypothetical protein
MEISEIETIQTPALEQSINLYKATKPQLEELKEIVTLWRLRPE